MVVTPGDEARQRIAVGRPTGAGALGGLILRLNDTGDGITGDPVLGSGSQAARAETLTLYGQRFTRPSGTAIITIGTFTSNHVLVDSPGPAGVQGTDSTSASETFTAQFAWAVQRALTVLRGFIAVRLRLQAAVATIPRVRVRLRRVATDGTITTLDELDETAAPVVAAGSTLDFEWALTIEANRAFAAGEGLVIEVEITGAANGNTFTIHHTRGSTEMYAHIPVLQ